MNAAPILAHRIRVNGNSIYTVVTCQRDPAHAVMSLAARKGWELDVEV